MVNFTTLMICSWMRVGTFGYLVEGTDDNLLSTVETNRGSEVPLYRELSQKGGGCDKNRRKKRNKTKNRKNRQIKCYITLFWAV